MNALVHSMNQASGKNYVVRAVSLSKLRTVELLVKQKSLTAAYIVDISLSINCIIGKTEVGQSIF